MAASSKVGRGWGRTLIISAGLFLVSGLIAGNLPGQTKGKKKEPVKEKEIKYIPDTIVGPSGQDQVAYINQAIEKGWKDNKIKPSQRCTDYEFIRRASLDIIGRIATVKEIHQFMAWPERERRSRLIEHLLKSPEYSSNFANIWTVLLLTRTGVNKVHQNQMRDWLTEKFGETSEDKNKAADWSKIVTELLTATGRTNENQAVNFILAHMGEQIKQNQAANGSFDMVPITSRATRLFLGQRTQCVQCHDHPFGGEWNQQHFWGINAFFRQVKAPQGRPTMMANKKKVKGAIAQNFTLEDDSGLNARGIVPYERRSGVLMYIDSTFLDGRKIGALKAKLTRREALARFITTSPDFGKAFVNRMWEHFMGKSFTKQAADDFGQHNEPSFPELLDRLAEDWSKNYQHNPKDVIRWICNSRPYGLSSIANETNDKPEDEVFFARMLLKAMTPEQLFESIMTATQPKVAKTDQMAMREVWLNKLVLGFGNDEGLETTFNGTVIQALMLMNGAEINKFIMDEKQGTVSKVLKQEFFSKGNAAKAVTELYMTALNRPPSGAELTKILNYKMITLPRVAPPKGPQQVAAFWTGYYQDLYWAIINSNEFFLNH
jgi:hypothetical protein